MKRTIQRFAALILIGAILAGCATSGTGTIDVGGGGNQLPPEIQAFIDEPATDLLIRTTVAGLAAYAVTQDKERTLKSIQSFLYLRHYDGSYPQLVRDVTARGYEILIGLEDNADQRRFLSYFVDIADMAFILYGDKALEWFDPHLFEAVQTQTDFKSVSKYLRDGGPDAPVPPAASRPLIWPSSQFKSTPVGGQMVDATFHVEQ